MTTREDIKNWLNNAPKNTTHMIVVCDTFDHVDYPVYVSDKQIIRDVLRKHENMNMQRIIEVYNFKMDLEQQLNEERVYNV